MRCRALGLAALAAVVLGLSQEADAHAHGGLTVTFYTPNRAVICEDWPADSFIICNTPNDGWTVTMYDSGHIPRTGEWNEATGTRWHNPYYDKPGTSQWNLRTGALLAFGHSWTNSVGIRCTSTRRGLTCTNGSGHGWWIGRYRGYRIF